MGSADPLRTVEQNHPFAVRVHLLEYLHGIHPLNSRITEGSEAIPGHIRVPTLPLTKRNSAIVGPRLVLARSGRQVRGKVGSKLGQRDAAVVVLVHGLEDALKYDMRLPLLCHVVWKPQPLL